MSKAYDRVNIHMLDLAMQRIKFPLALRSLLSNLFTKRTNQVITAHGLTDPYNVLIGIDQGEVISPLLWTIYYDPLLCEVNAQSHIGYTISHTWFKKLNDVSDVVVLQKGYHFKLSWIELLTSRVESSHESKTLNFKVLFIKLEYN